MIKTATVLLIFLLGIKAILTFQSVSPVFSNHDQARDIIAAKIFSEHRQLPSNSPYCGGCNLIGTLKNSQIYYLVLGLIYSINKYDSLLILSALWASLTIPLTFLITYQLIRHFSTAILSSLAVSLSPLLLHSSVNVPYQPSYLPTFSCLIIWLLLLNRHRRSIFLSILTGILLLLAIQFHLSALLLLPIYFIFTYQTIKIIPDNKRTILILFQITFVLVFIKLNINLNSTSISPSNLTISNILQHFFMHLSQDLTTLFPHPIHPVIFLLILLISIIINPQYRLLLPLILTLPITGISSYYNYYTAIFWPFLIILFIGIFRPLLNYIFYQTIILLVFITLSPKITTLLPQPITSASANNFELIKSISQEIDPHLSQSKPNHIYQYDNYLNTFTGYYLVRDLPLQDYRETLNDPHFNKLIYCQSQCSKFEIEFSQYQPTLLTTGDYRVYRFNK